MIMAPFGLSDTEFINRQRRLLPVRYEYFQKNHNLLFRFGPRLLKICANLPGLQEGFVTKMSYILQK
jgi:hypothetical protein